MVLLVAGSVSVGAQGVDAPVAASAPAPSAAVPLGLPEFLPLQPGVRDPVFAILIGLVEAGLHGTLDEDRLEAELKRTGKESPLPYKTLQRLTRLPIGPGQSAVTLDFNRPLHLPIPYSILGYHPGSFTASQHCVFREWTLPRVKLAYAETQADTLIPKTVELTSVHLFARLEGQVLIDIDGWLDAVMGGALDDTDVTALLLGRHNGEWLGFAMGYSRDHGGRSGVLSFAADKILFPTPSDLRTVGRQMRTKSERLLEEEGLAPGPSWKTGG